jgi:predicted neutral ceramidase superfamily lipid hydrolase
VFRGFINDATAAADALIARVVTQASIAVPFIIAFGFATAGVALILVEHFGHRNAYLILAVVFSVIGFLLSALIRSRRSEAATADARAEYERAAQAGANPKLTPTQLPLAVLAALVSSSVGPSMVLRVARGVTRNLPLIGAALIFGFLMWPKPAATDVPEDAAIDGDSEHVVQRSNGAYHPRASQEPALGSK